MGLTIELPPELQRRLEEEAAKAGQPANEFVRAVLEERLTVSPATRDAQIARNQRAMALLRQWSAEDAIDPDPHPVAESVE